MENETTELAVKNAESTALTVTTAESRFTGGMLANFFIGLLTTLVSIITLGLAYPAMVCVKERWVASHTYINGKQLTFDGKGMQLFGKYIIWLLLSVITLGIYYIITARVNIIKWTTKHTHIAGEEGKESTFTGHWYQLVGWNIVHGLVTIITLGLGVYWVHCHGESWTCKHTYIDGYGLEFDGKAIEYFGKCILWSLLTIITLGIYSLWLTIKSKKWTVSHTHFKGANVVAA